MLAHSPPLPVIIYSWDEDRKTTAEDEEGVLLALKHYDRVGHIRLVMPASTCHGDEPFPILERL
jgi:hypothetical protein